MVLGLVLIIYGYLCRFFKLFFFWESKYFGWVIFFIGIIVFLSQNAKMKKTKNKNTIFESIGIIIIIIMLIFQALFVGTVKDSDAYHISKKYILNDVSLNQKLGNIEDLFLIPSGSVNKISDSTGVYGNGKINFIVKGTKKNIDISINVVKYVDDRLWVVESTENY